MSRGNDSRAPDRQARVEDSRLNRIQALNNQFRISFSGGRVMLTAGVQDLASDHLAIALRRVATFDQFDASNDPYGEHDFGAIEIAGTKLFWKIDCYDKDLAYGSPDPAEPEVTTRVLTIMLASEY